MACSCDWLQMVDPEVGQQADPTVMAVETFWQEVPALLGEMKLLPYLQADRSGLVHKQQCQDDTLGAGMH